MTLSIQPWSGLYGAAPRFCATPLEVRSGPPAPGANTSEGLAGWGFSKQEIASLLEGGAAWQNPKKK